MTASTFTQVLGVSAAPAGTVDPGGVCWDPDVLRLRLGAFWATSQDTADHCLFDSRGAAKAAATDRGDSVVEGHGLHGFFVKTKSGTFKRVR